MDCHEDHDPHPSMDGHLIALGDWAPHTHFQTSLQLPCLVDRNLLLQHTPRISAAMGCVA